MIKDEVNTIYFWPPFNVLLLPRLIKPIFRATQPYHLAHGVLPLSSSSLTLGSMSKTFHPQTGHTGDLGQDYYLTLYNQRNEKGLAYIYEHYYDEVESFIRSKIPWCGDIDIIVNDSFKKTWRTEKPFESFEKLIGYVKKTALRLGIDYFNKRKRESSRFKRFINSLRGQQLSEFSQDPDTDYDMHEILQIVIDTFHKMPDNMEKKVLGGKLFDGLSYEELSKKYNIPINQVRSYKSRGLSRLKQFFLPAWRKKLDL